MIDPFDQRRDDADNTKADSSYFGHKKIGSAAVVFWKDRVGEWIELGRTLRAFEDEDGWRLASMCGWFDRDQRPVRPRID